MNDISLDEICEEFQLEIKKFRSAWIRRNATDPGSYPLIISHDNTGVWYECFMYFLEHGDI